MKKIKGTLHLNLKRKWFALIYQGIKKEEYRELKKYWKDRLVIDQTLLVFDTITFSNGYRKDRDQFVIEHLSTEIKTGNPEWGAENGKEYFVLGLGKIISSNI